MSDLSVFGLRTMTRCSMRSAVTIGAMILAAAIGSTLTWASGVTGEPPTLLLKWGTRGFGTGQLYRPWGMACDRDGNLYVAEQGIDRIQVFTGNGDYLRHWGNTGSAPERLVDATAVAIGPDGLAYVADHGGAVRVFTTNGTFVRSWGAPDPSGIAVDDSGHVYTCSYEGSGWMKFTSMGEQMGWFAHTAGPGLVSSPIGIATDGRDYVYVEGGGFLKRFATSGEFVSSTPVGNVTYLAVDGGGNIYVSLPELGRIEKYSPEWKLLASWGAPYNTDECGFNQLSGIAVDHNGNIFVADGFGPINVIPMCIQKFAFAPTPILRRTWGQIKAIYR